MRQLLILTLSALASSDSDAGRESQLLKILHERVRISSGEITIRVHFPVYERIPPLAGAYWTLHYWFESNRKAFRLDVTKSKDQEGEPASYRYAFDGKSYKLVDDVDRPEYPLREYVRMKPQAVPALFDPRLLGIELDSLLALRNYTSNDVERIVSKAVTWDREETGEGFAETYNHKEGLTYKYFFSRDSLPLRFLANSPAGVPEIRYEAQIGYDTHSPGGFDFPAKIEFKRYNAKKLAVHEIWEIGVIQIGQPIDRSLCSWQALDPKAGARLVVDHDYEHISRVWNGSGFERYNKFRAGPGAPQQSQAGGGRSWPSRLVVSGVSTLALGVVLAYRVIRRSRRSK